VSMSTYWGSNKTTVEHLGLRMGLTLSEITASPFVAGSMFVAKLAALAPLGALQLAADEFEPEDGQIDGTLAHAVERAIALSVVSAGHRISDTGEALGLRESALINDNYGHAEAPP